MKILVQKFGGTSVANKERREKVVQKIVSAVNEGYSPVVVVSAMGRRGDPYSTDTLINLVKSIYCDIGNREMDMIMSVGEIISCGVLYATLKSRGIDCITLTGGQAGIITNNDFNDASIIKVETEKLHSIIEKGIIPIVAGFQGITEDGQITTLGRGGSDTTAAVLGEALKACEIQIYTDVDGIMTADPRVVPDAKVIGNMAYNEVFQFADQGAKIIHPRAVEFAMKGNIPLVIKNTLSDAPGTVIANYYDDLNKRLVTGITYMPKRTQISIKTGFDDIEDDKLFNELARKDISIDLINVFPQYKAFTVDDECTERTQKILDELRLQYEVIRNCSKVSVIGEGIRGVPGVMAKIIKALKNRGIKILQTSDSHTTIWCLVREEDTSKAIIALHDEFNLSR